MTDRRDVYGELTSQFNGNLLINTRTISRTDALFAKVTDQRRSPTQISIAELSELLTLLEAIATSGSLFYDSTVPGAEQDRIRAAENRLESEIGNTDVFSGICPEKPSDIARLCQSSFEQSLPLMQRRIDEFMHIRGRPLARLYASQRRLPAAAARAFADAVLAPRPQQEELQELAEKLIEDNAFNGAKCVAGMLLCEQGSEAQLEGAGFAEANRAMLKDRSDDDLQIIVPALINAFRSNYLNVLGGDEQQAAFFAGPEIDTVLSQQIPLLTSHIARSMVKERLEQDITASRMAHHLQGHHHFPFLGLMILLSADEKAGPYALFNQSLQDKNMLLAEFMARQGGGVRYIHDMDSQALAEFHGAKLDSIASAMRRKVNLLNVFDRVCKWKVQPGLRNLPASIFAMNLILQASGLDLQLDGCLADFQHSADAAANYLEHSNNFADVRRYQTFTQNIETRLEDIRENDADLGQLIEDRLQKVLNCTLVH